MKSFNLFLLLCLVGLLISCTPNQPDDDSNDSSVTEHIVEPTKTQMTEKEIGDEKRFDSLMKEKITTVQKETGVKICNCMNDIALYHKLVDAKSQIQFDEIAGKNAFQDVLAIQNCHNKIMPDAIKEMDRAKGAIYAFKSRNYLQKKCMNNNIQLWFYMAEYISTHRPNVN